MSIADQALGRPGYGALPVVALSRDGRAQTIEKLAAAECCLRVYSQARLLLKMICSPGCLGELVLGYFYSEGLIASAEEISCIRISQDGQRADIFFREGGDREQALPQAEQVLSAGGAVRLRPGCRREARPLSPLPHYEWQPEQVFALADTFYQAKTHVYEQTGAAHSCFLSLGGAIRYSAEDIGRHNALDKVIGRALLDGGDLSQALAYTSGRVPVDMAAKAIRSRIPVLVSKSLPTVEAAALAKQYRLTLICLAKPQGLLVFADGAAISPERKEAKP